MRLRLKDSYSKLSLITISAVYLLILIGGIVRSTGAGMGCPDWPKCYGQLLPPTDVSQLPSNYQEIYSEIRHQKNLRISKMLDYVGFDDLANKIVSDEKIRVEAEFNVTKTWIEYVNRLIGVLIGLLIFATFVCSLFYYKSNFVVFGSSLAAFVLVGIEGWLGSIVVSTNLLPGTITVHMLLALLIVSLLIYAYFKSKSETASNFIYNPRIRSLIFLALVLYLFQVAVGSQVREAIDAIVLDDPLLARVEWIDRLGLSFYIHRSYSLLILALNIYIVFILRKTLDLGNPIYRLTKILIYLIVIEILTGALMAYLSIPAFLQPIHLFIASLIFGLQFYIYCNFTSIKNIPPVKFQNP